MTHSPAVVQQIQQPEPMIKEEPKMPEIQVPVKKYYGRKRDNQSSSDEEYSLDEVDSTDKTKYAFHSDVFVDFLNERVKLFSFLFSSEAVKNSHAGKAATTHTKVSKNNSELYFPCQITNHRYTQKPTFFSRLRTLTKHKLRPKFFATFLVVTDNSFFCY